MEKVLAKIPGVRDGTMLHCGHGEKPGRKSRILPIKIKVRNII
jgi:hypothetical protein